jgi:hypothetical protein
MFFDFLSGYRAMLEKRKREASSAGDAEYEGRNRGFGRLLYHLSYLACGQDRDRTCDLLRARTEIRDFDITSGTEATSAKGRYGVLSLQDNPKL